MRSTGLAGRWRARGACSSLGKRSKPQFVATSTWPFWQPPVLRFFGAWAAPPDTRLQTSAHCTTQRNRRPLWRNVATTQVRWCITKAKAATAQRARTRSVAGCRAIRTAARGPASETRAKRSVASRWSSSGREDAHACRRPTRERQAQSTLARLPPGPEPAQEVAHPRNAVHDLALPALLRLELERVG